LHNEELYDLYSSPDIFGHAVAQVVEALRYKLADQEVDSQ
jgi:hypothetical protein